MQRIAVLIDFTPGSIIALKQAEDLAQKTSAQVHAINVTDSADKVELTGSDLKKFVVANSANPARIQIEIGVGQLLPAVASALKRLQPDLVIVCTHRIKGIAQHLFGANILKLVQSIHFPTIVVHENNKVNISTVTEILFPLGPHPEFETKIKQTAALAKVLNASVTMYEIDSLGSDVDNHLEKNRSTAKKYFMDANIETTNVLDEVKFVSAGYSRQTLEYAVDHQIGLISLMATVSKNDLRFGTGDKENFLVNAAGIPVLCCMS